MTLHEPGTFATDLLLSALAGWLAIRLQATASAKPVTQWWGQVFWLTAAAALVGGVTHGFGPELPASIAGALWRSTLLILDLTSAALAMALLAAIVPLARQNPWKWIIAGKFAVFCAAAFSYPKFVVAVIDYGLALLAWLIVALVWLRPWMLAAIAVSLIAATVQQLRWGIGLHLNHNDVYHLVQAAALVCFYRAALAEGMGAAGSPIAIERGAPRP